MKIMFSIIIKVFSIIIIVFIVYTAIVAIVFLFKPSLVFDDIYENINFTNIKITNSDGLTIMPDMEITQEEILSMLGGIQFSRDKIFLNQYPVLYRIKFFMGSMERRNSELYILNSNSIVYRTFIYKCADDSINLEYFKKLFE